LYWLLLKFYRFGSVKVIQSFSCSRKNSYGWMSFYFRCFTLALIRHFAFLDFCQTDRISGTDHYAFIFTLFFLVIFFLRQKYKMSSVQSVVASPSRGARFFVSTAAASNTYTATGAATPGGGSVAAGVVVRDMGKTIRTPGAGAVGTLTSQVLLRKVARANSGATALASGGVAPAAGFVGFVEGNEDASNIFYTFYINLYDGEWAAVSL
jgi:hypothetical protein